MMYIADKLGITHQNVNRILKKYRMYSEDGGAYAKMHQRLKQTEKLVEQGLSVIQIAAELKVTRERVYQYKKILRSDEWKAGTYV